MLEDTIERANWHVYPELSGHRDRAGLNIVLKLTVTTAGPDVPPPILFEEPNYFANLHVNASPMRCLTFELSAARATVWAWHFVPHACAPAIC